ncbi:hypothetical protein B0H19DRAFT_1271737 [Mycena capillaripes]|nr:hypothetical protein B0H19DRAFT_1271737 [Mycena capillaripes]
MVSPQPFGPALPVGIPHELNTIDEETLQLAAQIEGETVATIDPDDNLYVAPADDTAVPLWRIIRASAGLDLPAASLPQTETFCVTTAQVVENDTGSLQVSGVAEDVWAYHDNGVPFDETNLPVGESSDT